MKTIVLIALLSLPACTRAGAQVIGQSDREFCDNYCDGADGVLVEVRGSMGRSVECVCATIDPD